MYIYELTISIEQFIEFQSYDKFFLYSTLYFQDIQMKGCVAAPWLLIALLVLQAWQYQNIVHITAILLVVKVNKLIYTSQWNIKFMLSRNIKMCFYVVLHL